ncbi:MAG: DUF456 domain-containing protein [Cyclobacteriaceae bacterium]|nr:DUF456 domain-containing protein [Cyclobacteriaceae bacterium]
MDFLLIFFGIILLIVGIAGCFIPAVPGPPVAFLSLLLLQFRESPPFATTFLIILAIVVVIVAIIDHFIPVIGARKWGGSRAGAVGAFIGILLGFFIWPPFGFIIMPFLGALTGELLGGNSSKTALKAALGTIIGLIVGTILKLTLTIIIAWYFFVNL